MLTHSPAYFRATCKVQGGPDDTYSINTTHVDALEHGPPAIYSIIGDSQKHDTTRLLETYLGASVKCETTVTPPMSKYYEVRWIALDPHSSRSLRVGLMTQRVEASDTMISTTLWFNADTALGDYELVCSFHQIHLRQTLLDTSIRQSIAQVTLRLRLNLVEEFKLHPEQSTYLTTNSIVLCQVRSPLNPKPILMATGGSAAPKTLPNPFKISEENTRQGPLVVSCTVQVNKRVSLRLRRSYTVFFRRPTTSGLALTHKFATCSPQLVIGRSSYLWYIRQHEGNDSRLRVLPYDTPDVVLSKVMERWGEDRQNLTLGCTVTSSHLNAELVHICEQTIEVEQAMQDNLVLIFHNRLMNNAIVFFLLQLLFLFGLSPTESRYSTGGKELLALFLAVKHFPYFLESRDLTVLTDNRPLYFALKSTSDKLNPRKIRQLDYISQFTPDIRQIDGSSNVVADALSRPSIAHLRLSPSIDLAKMAAEQRRVGSPCEEDVSELQLQVLALTTANGTIL
ncbi:hypothetical protein SprV_0602110900 [Sparganum proliferum]